MESRETVASGQDKVAAAADFRASRLEGLSRKALEFVRQPNFWLACVVAVAVQIVLAFVMTPADAGPDGEKRPLTSAKGELKKFAEEPAARILVPAAPANLHDERSEPLPASASPMGPTSPQEPPNDASVQGNAPLSDMGDRWPSARMAENRPLGDGSAGLDGRPDNHADGATLGGIAPLEPGLPADNQGQLR